MKSEDGLGIEYDENVICDVCRSPDSEEANEMVFCDNCNICVHQACYGITTIPSGKTFQHSRVVTSANAISFWQPLLFYAFSQDNGYAERVRWDRSPNVCYVRTKVVQ
jgi:PHD-finger